MKKRKIIFFILFALYGAVLLLLLFGRNKMPQSEISYIPFRTTKMFIEMIMTGNMSMKFIGIVNLVGNVIMFVPFGFFVSYLLKGKNVFAPFLGICLAFVIAVESTQYFTGLGIADVDDVILNTIGCIIGYFCMKIFKKLFKKAV